MTNSARTARLLLIPVVLLTACSREPRGREVHVAAAANLSTVLEEISRAFSSTTGIRVVRTLGATAQLTQQIQNGAPIDVFLAADTQHVDQLIAGGFARAATRAVYVRGRLALWAPSHPEIRSLGDLARPEIKQVGCAKPELAPYGAAAVQSLKKAGVWGQVEPKIVYGPNISVSKQFADSGNVAAAFTALSLIYNLGGHYVLIDEKLHSPIDQALCIVSRNSQPELAQRFRDFVLSERGRAIFERFGYSRENNAKQ